MVVIDWLQTCEFVRENSERFILYCLCGCFIGISIILITIIIVLYIQKRNRNKEKDKTVKNNYQIPRNDADFDDDLSGTRPYLPVYRYDGRNHNKFFHV